MPSNELPVANIARIRRRLRNWYASHARDLPWRKTADPYCVWISEIMLQQTQVETVRRYFARFVEQFPDVTALAAAQTDHVLRLWEGLGYYRRARQLHHAARIVVAEYDAQLPCSHEALMKLPGIGRYTAGAILSIGFGIPAPILEANTLRLYARLLKYADDPRKAAGQRKLWTLAEQLVPRQDPGRFNQALMELGSQVCQPTPRCDCCPLRPFCPTAAAGLQTEIPRPPRRTQYEDIDEVALIIRKGNQVLLRRCAANERWAGLWDFPRLRLSDPHDPGTIARQFSSITGILVDQPRPSMKIKHGVTRYRIQLHCYTSSFRSGRCRKPYRWHASHRLRELPLSRTGRQIGDRVQQSD